MIPRSLTLTPSSFTLSASTLPMRPIVYKTLSDFTCLPLFSSVNTPPSSSTVMQLTSSPRRRTIAVWRIQYLRLSTTSLSAKPSISGLFSMSVTLTPRHENMLAYSHPITPAPIMVSRSGSLLSASIVSLSYTWSSSNGMPSGRAGRVPVEMIITPALSLSLTEFLSFTMSVNLSSKLASP